ncbi:lysine--tRNA ligase [bacterium]|nr:lysine--tRNA ligase [bacterium]
MLPEELTQEEQRLQKLLALQEAGRDPFAIHRYERTHLAQEAVAAYEEPGGQKVCVCGRLMTRRAHGKSTFADLVDQSGKIQLYAKLDDLGAEGYEAFKDLDIGDILGVRGELFLTRTGEVTVKVSEFTLLSKSLRPLPEKWHGLQDTEARYRQRYLDLIMNPESREVFEKRARMTQAVRDLLCSRGFHEVETPVLQPLYGGANARPFTTHHNALDMTLYMRIAPELYLKRLVVGGMERVFEIGKLFRNEGIDTRHNPEFTSLEAYQAYADYEDMMDLVEQLVCAMAQSANGSLEITYGEYEIDLTPPWRRIGLYESIREAAGVDFSQIETDEAAREACKDLDVGNVSDQTLAGLLDRVFDRYVQPTLIQPTFVVDYPVAISPLAKRKAGDPELTARFEPFIGGAEVGNAFSELNDPLDQQRRFEAQVEARRVGDEEAHPLDEDFVRALEYGLPPTGGLGLGIDRLAMLICNRQSIREVILFPVMKPSQDE